MTATGFFLAQTLLHFVYYCSFSALISPSKVVIQSIKVKPSESNYLCLQFLFIYLFILTRCILLQRDYSMCKKHIGTQNNSIYFGREILWVEPNAQDQLNKEPLNKAKNWVPAVSASSNMQQFSSRKIVDINKTELKFQTSNKCCQFHFSNQIRGQWPFPVTPTNSQKI